MKKLSIYCIVDIVSETILSVFSAISDEMAVRQFEQALEANKDKIYDKESIKLYVSREDVNVSDSIFTYCVPETFDEVSNHFVDFAS